MVKEDGKPGRSTSRGLNQQPSAIPVDREVLSQAADGVLDTNPTSPLVGTNGNVHPAPRKVSASSQRSTVLAAHSGGTANPTGEGESADLIDSTMKNKKDLFPLRNKREQVNKRKGD